MHPSLFLLVICHCIDGMVQSGSRIIAAATNTTCINGKINVTIDVGMNLVLNNQPFICYG